MTTPVKRVARQAAREAEAKPAVRVLARSGFAANGIVHLIIGAIIIALAAGARGEGDQAGALKTIAAAPLGFVLLWLLAVALAALGVWHLAEGILMRAPGDDVKGEAKKWGRRIGEWGQAVVFLVLGGITATVALGARPNAEETAEGASRGVLSLPGGSWVLAVVGLGIGIGGIAFVVMGVRRSFRNKVSIPSGALGRTITVLGVVGFVAKGIALAIVGVLALVAAVKVDPTEAAGIDGAVDALLALTLGPWLVGVIGVGFVAYGVFCLFRAPYADL